MSGKARRRKYSSPFDQERRLAYVRSKNQAAFRGESWSLSFEEFCAVWHDESLWDQRGRDRDSLVMTRRDPYGRWDKSNVCLISRLNQIRIIHALAMGRSIDEFYKEALL